MIEPGQHLPRVPFTRPDNPPEDPNQDRNMLQHAWHIGATQDPLEDSDQEADEHVRLDYSRRLRVLTRLRGKEPTPEPEPGTYEATDPSRQPPPPPPGAGASDGGEPRTGRLSQVQSWQ